MTSPKIFFALALFFVSATFGGPIHGEYIARLPVSHQVFQCAGYVVCYDAQRRCPAWVYEVLTADGLEGRVDRGSFQFKEDDRIPWHIRAEMSDYVGSGFDRGHLAPAADCKSSDNKMRDSFLLSNVCPQNPSCNRGAWARLEKHVRDLTKTASKVHVVSGPLYLPQADESGKRWVKYQVIGENDVAAPTHFFKLIVLEDVAGNKKSIGYVLPNEHIPSETPLYKFEMTVDKIERLSGIILSALIATK